jgi:hypothetical protein
MITAITSVFRAIARDKKGATLPLFALGFLMLISAVGLAVDYGRAQMVQSKLQASLDAAALAAAATANSEDNEARKMQLKMQAANKYMEANFPVNYMNTLYPSGGNQYITDLRITDNGEGLSVTARGEVETILMNIVGFDRVDVEAYTEIALETSRFGLEVVLVLDNTGSMYESNGGERKIAALKRAAKNLVDDIYDKFDSNKTYIGIVPFSNSVRVGNAKSSGSAWKRANAGSNIPVSDPVNCIYTDTSYHTPSRDISYGDTNQIPVGGRSPSALFFNASGDNSCNNVAMRAMSNNVPAIRNTIDSMITSGNTRIDLGAVWGWRMISPSWRGLWSHNPPTLPLNFNEKDMSKVVIILTDGFNVDGNATIVQRANDRLTSVCQKMKMQDIIVYTVTLHDTGAAALMRGCATSNQHYFHVPPGASLDNAFEQIADSLANLRISR